MINALIWGTEEISFLVKKIIKNIYNPVAYEKREVSVNVIGFIKDRNKDEKNDQEDIFSLNDAIEGYKNGVVSIIIIPIDIFLGINDILFSLIKHIKVEDIYLFERAKNYDSDRILDMINPYCQSKYLPYLEYHIADHCNLNCRACEHYSGLVKEPVYPDYRKFEVQFGKLKQYIDDIGVIRILGGEPLLNKEIEKYMMLTRKLYPDASICIVTNAILIMSMNDSFFETMKKNQIYFSISYYPPLEGKMEKILDFIKEKGVEYIIFDIAKEFTIKQTLIKQNTPDYFFRCVQARCNNFYDGKIAACFLPFTTKYFNEEFNDKLTEPLPEDGAIDIMDEGVSTEIIKKKLLEPFERCRFCTDPVTVKWERLGHENNIYDWVQK